MLFVSPSLTGVLNSDRTGARETVAEPTTISPRFGPFRTADR
ncbi:hypothetical protein HSB1_32880 [Halogranum salarium B-1]|uniref:Uncharacterized protein n=1 Tax=Halogranum salarium B-1 TaxID=1210908 RepID=J3JDX6_9EURY|nr:hypothetical protein HSB1_32880 [Halogranum salarium B-1]